MGSGGIPAGYTVVIDSANTIGESTVLTANGSFSNDGTIDLTDSSASSGSASTAELDVASGTLTNDGTINSQVGSSYGYRVIDGNVTNASDGTITVAQNLQVDANGAATFANAGPLTIDSGATLYVNPDGQSGVVFDVTGGKITDNGAIREDWNTNGSPEGNGTLSVGGGSMTGGPILASSLSSLSFSSGGNESVELEGSTTLNNLSSGIPTGYTVIVDSSNTLGESTVLTANGSFSNDGTIDLTDSSTSSGSASTAELDVASGTFTNDGTINSQAGAGGYGYRDIEGNITNASNGTINVDQNVEFDTHASDATLTHRRHRDGWRGCGHLLRRRQRQLGRHHRRDGHERWDVRCRHPGQRHRGRGNGADGLRRHADR